MSLLIAPIEALTDPTLSDPERRVLLALFSFRGRDTNTIWPSLESIAERANINDVPRVSKITSSLVLKGWLSKKRRGFTGGNTYTLMFPERFNATNLADSTELETDTNLENDTNLAPDTNLVGAAKLVPDTNTKLARDTKSKLVPDTKYKEQTTEEYKEQTNIFVGVKKPPTCPHEKIIEIYHECLPQLPRVIHSSWKGSKREGYLKQRWRQDPEYQKLEFWRWYFSGMRTAANGFYVGNNDKAWHADIEFLLKKSNFDKYVEKLLSKAA